MDLDELKNIAAVLVLFILFSIIQKEYNIKNYFGFLGMSFNLDLYC